MFVVVDRLTEEFFTALHRFLAQDNVSLGLLGVWALSDLYVLFHTTTSIESLSAEDIDTTDEYLFGHAMAIVPFALLLPRVEESAIGELHKTAKTTGWSVLIFILAACLAQDHYGFKFSKGYWL